MVIVVTASFSPGDQIEPPVVVRVISRLVSTIPETRVVEVVGQIAEPDLESNRNQKPEQNKFPSQQGQQSCPSQEDRVVVVVEGTMESVRQQTTDLPLVKLDRIAGD